MNEELEEGLPSSRKRICRNRAWEQGAVKLERWREMH